MDASIIVLTKNSGPIFPKLLERLFSQEYADGFEVVMIDSGSTDETLEVAKKFPVRLTEIKPEEFHHSKTRNLGAELSKGKYLVYITQDALPVDNQWLKALILGFADPDVAMVVGRQLPWNETKPPEKFFYHYNFPDFKILVKPGAEDYYHDNVFISNVNSAIRKDIWVKYRFSDEIVMAEDKEIAIRLLNAGFSILYNPEPAVFHAHDYSVKNLFERSLDYGLALRQGISSLPKSKMNYLERIFSLFGTETRFFKKNSAWKWLPYAIVYNLSMYLGIFLGKAGLLKGPMGKKVIYRNG